jgi:hypothetical protein
MKRPHKPILQALLPLCGIALLNCATHDELPGNADETPAVESTKAALKPNESATPIPATADTFLRKYDDDTNFGTNSELRAEGTSLSATEHTLVRFDPAAITAAIGPDTFVKAELELTINHISGFYGDGTVTLHRMTMPWTEQGATWDCANDTNTANFWPDCALADRWGMEWLDPYPQPYVSTPTGSVYVSALQTGTIRFDVTADVANFLANPATNRGWMLRATHDPIIVRVHFRSRETTDPPRLLLTHAVDSCPNDTTKTDPGVCGCGVPDTDTDGDSKPDCLDECPHDRLRVVRGQCGCVGEPFAPAAGTPCSDSFCASTTAPSSANKCDGAGSCGSPTLSECLPTSQPSAGCTVRVYNNHAYLFCTSDLSFTAARTYCGAANMELVRIDDAGEDTFVGSNLSEPSWIGASDTTTEGQWRWLDGNTQFWQGSATGTLVPNQYAHWKAGEPAASSSSDDCAIYDRSSAGAPLGWDDRGCTTTRGFVCERLDQCPVDALKTKPGICGCGVADSVITIDGQQVVTCTDQCPDDPDKVTPGKCGCGMPEGLCPIECPNNLSNPSSPVYGKLQAGRCGCNTPDVDANNNKVLDCFESPSQCGTASAPQPVGTACSDSICAQSCPITTTCNGAGVCGNPNACAPTGAGTCVPKLFRDHVYWFCNGLKTRDEAKVICAQDGVGSLVSIDDPAENEFVHANITTNSWTGGNQTTTQGAWTWSNAKCEDADPFWDGGASGKPHRDSAYTDWQAGAPSGGSYAFVAAGTAAGAGSWGAQSGGSLAFVCEKPRPLAPSCLQAPGCLTEYLGVGSCAPETHEACVPASTALPNLAGLSSDQALAAVENCNNACKPEACVSPMTQEQCRLACEQACAAQGIDAPPANSSCSDTSGAPEIAELCRLAEQPTPVWYPDPATGQPIPCKNTFDQCVSRGDLPADVVCGFMVVCTREPGTQGLPQCPEPVQGGPDVPLAQGGKTGTVRVCGKPSADCLTGQGGDPVRCDSSPLLCETADSLQEVETLTFPEGEPRPVCPADLFKNDPAPEPDLTHEYTSWSEPCGPGGCVGTAQSGENNPYCKYRSADDGAVDNEIDPAVNHARAQNQNKAGSKKLIDFEFNPRLDLDYHAKLGPLGVPDIGVTAGAGLVAKAVFNGNKLPFSGDVELVNLTAQAHADRCSVTTAGSHIRLFGHDFLPADVGLDAKIQGCEEAFTNFEKYANQASKTMRDAASLLKQYEGAKGSGKRLDLSPLCALGGVLDDPPADFPLPLNCADQPAESHLNELIDYYEQKVVDLLAAGAGLANDALSIRGSWPVFQAKAGDEEITLFTAQFFIGPIPVTLEAFIAASYQIGLSIDYAIQPAKAVAVLLLPNAQTGVDHELLGVHVNGGPSAQAFLGFFAGAGFSVGPVAASIGIEARLSLGVLALNVQGGAGLIMTGQPDPRPLAADLASIALPGEPPLIKPLVYKLKLGYSAGLSAEIRNILSGDVNARLKLKFFFFSKTFRQRLLRFNGFCTKPADLTKFPCHIPILELGSSTTLADLPWATIRMGQVLPKLKYLPYAPKPDPATATQPVDMKHLEKLFYSRLCSCVAPGKECATNGDCCDGLSCSDDGTGKKTCSCRNSGQTCATDGDCCSGAACVNDGTGQKTCGCRNSGQTCAGNNDCCSGTPCVGGHCQCTAVSAPCQNDTQCCGEICKPVPGGGRCKCSALDDVCATAADCCAGLICFQGQCEIQGPD